ncbi:hypothetical protein B0H63DRAFT_483492 [Podospora didyma]|uniref:Uncharacterized protein n=1 Tax=Podospora didyma TaxID=330526 RepID=A0AAE0K9M0_9PEZI|nr:hypothetical protein B0H63DRAFT_483492 [Podospora didyma]
MWEIKPIYKAIPAQTDDHDDDAESFRSSLRAQEALLGDHVIHAHVPFRNKACLLVSIVMNVVLLGIILFVSYESVIAPSPHRHLIYSPANSVVRYEVKKFAFGFDNATTSYQGQPSPELDNLWKDLYHDVAVVRLPRSEAERLPNKTTPFPGDDGYYVGALGVFHQLHCINSIRIALNKEYYTAVLPAGKFDPAMGPYGATHINHCVDALREAVMCAGDTSVLTWKWHATEQRALVHADVLHTCRSFEDIWEWSNQNRAVMDFNPAVYVEDDLVLTRVTAHKVLVLTIVMVVFRLTEDRRRWYLGANTSMYVPPIRQTVVCNTPTDPPPHTFLALWSTISTLSAA